MKLAKSVLHTSGSAGPDIENNCLALCSLHHKLFDRGAFTISEDLRIQVADRAHGTKGVGEWLMAFHGKDLIKPQRVNGHEKVSHLWS